MDDVVLRLRDEAKDIWMDAGNSDGGWATSRRQLASLLDEAADEIKRLRQGVSKE